ncbi:SCO family protein [Kordia jejudonensis]|uniref:SCO family protein n=1 Tax=Kordia jejudonensis TaxID=1348245 RepID=UPI0006297C95|nr:SCO family protein [Kordia jejudonensis]
MNKLTAFLVIILSAISCKNERLPILGQTTTDNETGEVLHYKAPSFNLTNQLSSSVTEADFKDKIHVVDFFFTSCPTICPQMTNHLKLVEKVFMKEDRVAIISYSIDPKNDTPEQLKRYAKNYDIDNNKWTFLTGNSETIFELSKDYKVRAFDDSNDLGKNLIHDGTFVLVDGSQRIRGYYNGLEEMDTKRLIKDILTLLKE